MNTTSMAAEGAVGRGPQWSVYSSSGVLQFTADRNRDGFPTVKLEAAPTVRDVQPREYDWPNKVANFQLTPAELPLVAAVLCGFRQRVQLDGHGVKWLDVEHQGSHLFAKLGEAKRYVAVPISPGDTFHLVALIVGQLSKAWGLSESGAMAILRQIGQMART